MMERVEGILEVVLLLLLATLFVVGAFIVYTEVISALNPLGG